MKNRIIKTLEFLPKHWPLTLVNSKKQPLGNRWQDNPFTPAQLQEAFIQGFIVVKGKTRNYPVKPEGIGLLCGVNSQEFLFAIDFDGFSAYQYWQKRIRKPIPTTVSFTSGRKGRCQYLLKLPLPESIKSIKIPTAPGEGIEIRGSHHQSVLPPSPHPITGQYRWVNSPVDTEVAIAPDWLIEWIENQRQKKKTPRCNEIQRFNRCHQFPVNPTTINGAIGLLELIPRHFADDYHTWIKVGMALKYISPMLLDAWERWSQSSVKYKPGECAYKWRSFRGAGISERTLYYLARK